MPVDTDEPLDDGYPPDGPDLEFPSQRIRQRGALKARSSRILAQERQRRALELRKAGSTYEAIAQSLGYSDPSGARAAVVRAFDQVIQEPAKEVRTLQIERLNHMLLVLWPKVQTGDERAIDSALRIMDKIDRLMGTDAPLKVEHDHNVSGAVLVVDGDKDAYIRAMQRLVGEDAPALPTGGVVLPVHEPVVVEAEVVEDHEVLILPNQPTVTRPVESKNYDFKVRANDDDG